MKRFGQAIGIYICFIFLPHLVVADFLYTDCGGFLTEERGFIKSPKFPDRFPTPISCHWVIQAPPERKIILYFTQYFLRSGFYLSEYDKYESEESYTGKNNLGEINFEDEFTSLVAYKPFVVITFNVRDNGNIHLRVEDYLQDVYGFNITYEVVGVEEKVGRDACSVHECSYLGNCMANFNYSEYRCHCFEGFFGNECQYGPYCDPDKGTNMCENGGRCRYFYGSLVNTCECPPGYEGSKCHLKTDRPFNEAVTMPEDCENLGCSQLCEQSQDGSFYCSCVEGFKLDTDNATCMEKEMYRITASVPVRKDVIIPGGFTSPHEDVTARLRERVIYTLDLSGIKSVTGFGFDGVRDQSGKNFMTFHFYVENIELELVNRGLQFLTTGDRLFGVDVDTDALRYQADPEMKLLGVEHYGQRPAVEGNLLTITCTARGSGQMKYRWYKDGSLLNTTLSQRNAWEIRIPRTLRNKQISILNIDGVEFYDKGEFTCEIEDFKEVDNASVIVDVITLPLLEMSPLAVSLTKGGATSFRCLSPDDTIEKGSFSYKWLKNGNQIPPDSTSEIIEDVFPTGRRLNIRNAQHSANYTCIITNPAGSTNKTAFLFVKKPEDIQGYCLQDIYEGITWKKTFGGCFDVQRCPTDTGDLRVIKALGYSRRSCECMEQRCEWSKPNFVKCQSGHLIITYDRLEKIKLGYQHDKMSSIWEDLYGLIRQARGKLYAGDVDVSSSILHTFVKTLAQYPSLAPQNGSYSLTSLLDLTNILLAEALLTSNEEKESLYVGPKVMQIMEMLCGLRLRNFNFSVGLHITNEKIVALVQDVRIVPPNASLPKLAHGTDKPSYVLARGSRSRREKVSISKNGHSDYSDVMYGHEPMFICYYVDMYSLLHDNYAEKIHDPDFVTGIRSVFPFDNFFLQKAKKAEIVFHHPRSVILQGSNETSCISWRTTRRFVTDHDILNGHWSVHDCNVVQRNATSTTCWCDVPGHFALVVKQINVTIPIVPETYEGILLSGCIASMCGLVATLIVYLFTWRHLVGETHCIHINFVLSLTVINAICILCLGKTQIQALCAAGKILLQFFYLAAFTFLFVEAVHMFVTVHARRSVSGGFLKYFLIGWGIPTLAAGSVVVASERYGYDERCREWCWLSDTHWHFYSFLVPVIVLVVAQLILCTVSAITVRGWKEEWRYKDRRKHMFTAGKCGVLQVLLTMSCVSGTFIEPSSNTSFVYMFLLVEIILGTAVFCFLVLMKRQIRLSIMYMLNRSEKSEMTRKFSSRSFKAYMMPEKIDEQRETIEESIHRHQSEINRNKFTRERKKQLEHLLGSSSSGGSASASASASGSGSASDNSRESQIRFMITPHRGPPTDAGISDIDNGEICSMKNTVDIHYISPVPEDEDVCDADVDDDHDDDDHDHDHVDCPSEILVCASRVADGSLVTLHT
ncbi:uncharacterized protein [Haliotis asinina]|uniref:uncharacterized protein isoform X2 n=1 Tax=Haliotis asinina TaxID=109174 RepID=UPI003531A571